MSADPPDAVARAAAAAALGLAGRRAGAAAELDALVRHDPDARVRGAAVAARVRRAPRGARATWLHATHDPDARVRRRALETAPLLAGPDRVDPAIARSIELLADPDPLVAEAAAFALGELAGRTETVPAPRRRAVVDALAGTARDHPDPLAREAAVAALGAVGARRGLPAILAALDDKPAIRRRAVLALAPFRGPEVDAALDRARDDRDWQVRQAAEDLG